MLELNDEARKRVRPLKRVEFDRLIEAGVLGEDDRVELLFGFLVAMSPIGAPHAATVDRLTRILVRALGDRAVVRVQNPLALSDDSEPQPDLSIVPTGEYDDALPSEALLVIEVADSSLETDRAAKATLYASSGVPEYWVVNLIDKVIEVHAAPAGGAYTHITSHGRDEVLRPLRLPDVEIRVADILR